MNILWVDVWWIVEFFIRRNMAEVEENFENFEEPQPAVVETAAVDDGLALAQPSEVPDVKLFGRWSCDDVHVSDMSLAVRKRLSSASHVWSN